MTWALVTVCGNLGAKPTIKHFDTGNVVCNFVLYVNRPKSGETDGPPPLKLYVDVWGKQADSCMNLLDKGSKATVTGTLDEESYQDREGNPVTQIKVRFAQVLDYGFKPSGDRPGD
ncbi:single-stranded DNA-binding protein [Neosynechococcus sphagnicola]|uniref:single-stranded DNA-binding protein n=1 Tax=Neosynechococcus sphagnicola TaxID=1501145 RepID=UPI00138E08C0|nr:single-stranded DNA-binding protein [Neosynechococcus sphagnicola]